MLITRQKSLRKSTTLDYPSSIRIDRSGKPDSSRSSVIGLILIGGAGDSVGNAIAVTDRVPGENEETSRGKSGFGSATKPAEPAIQRICKQPATEKAPRTP